MCFTTRIFKLIFHSLKKSTYLLSKGLLWLYVKKKNKKNTWLLAVMELLFSCSTRYQEIITIYFLLLDTSLVHWPHSWDSELNTWGEIPYQHALLYYSIYWTRKKWSSLSYSVNAKSLKSYPLQRVLMRICGLIAQWSVFLRSFFTHSHLNREDVRRIW